MAHISQTEIRKLDFTLLLVMRGLLRHRRTTVVAAELGLSQSAISYALGRLRTTFADPLFVRRPHGLAPTGRAVELGPLIEAILQKTEDAIGLGDTFDPATATRAFRIGVLEYLSSLIGPRLLETFEREAPNARFGLRVLRGDAALEALRRDEIDLALGQFSASVDGLSVMPIATDRYCLVARTGNPKLSGRIAVQLLARLSHVVVSVDGDFRTPTDQPFQDLGLERRVCATAPTFMGAFAMVAQSDAVCIAPRGLAERLARPLGLAVHDLPQALPPIRLLLVRREGRDAGARWLADRAMAPIA